MSVSLFSRCQRHGGLGGGIAAAQSCDACMVERQQPATPKALRDVINGPWGRPAPSAREERIAFLERKRVGTKADLLLKFQDEDYHGVADAAMDLRDIESELKGLRL